MIDIGANLADRSFEGDLDEVLVRAWNAGLTRIVVTGSDACSNNRALALARAYPHRLHATAGLHPHHASTWNRALLERLKDLASVREVLAVGECGLDYYRDLSPKRLQRQAFVDQLELAASLHKPVFLHQRSAHTDFHAIIREYRDRLTRCVVHCFTDDGDALDSYLALDCYIGITGWICDERRGLHLRKLVQRIPAARLLIESDAPYLLPRNLRPAPKHRRNEPAFLPWVARCLAEARVEDFTRIAEQTSANAARFFGGWSQQPSGHPQQADQEHGQHD